ncbi:hypothetical protein B0H11DRAFT_2434065 [Mycena galericulata]|nr:hypothetical protein B0H11DRAFT_2434065 [Mycena galericulata]
MCPSPTATRSKAGSRCGWCRRGSKWGSRGRWNLERNACTRTRDKAHGAPPRASVHISCAEAGGPAGIAYAILRGLEEDNPPLRIHHNLVIIASRRTSRIEWPPHRHPRAPAALVLPPLLRKIRVSAGVFKVTLLRVLEERGSVDAGDVREFKWDSIILGAPRLPTTTFRGGNVKSNPNPTLQQDADAEPVQRVKARILAVPRRGLRHRHRAHPPRTQHVYQRKRKHPLQHLQLRQRATGAHESIHADANAICPLLAWQFPVALQFCAPLTSDIIIGSRSCSLSRSRTRDVRAWIRAGGTRAAWSADLFCVATWSLSGSRDENSTSPEWIGFDAILGEMRRSVWSDQTNIFVVELVFAMVYPYQLAILLEGFRNGRSVPQRSEPSICRRVAELPCVGSSATAQKSFSSYVLLQRFKLQVLRTLDLQHAGTRTEFEEDDDELDTDVERNLAASA